jgi:hypothetical protein
MLLISSLSKKLSIVWNMFPNFTYFTQYPLYIVMVFDEWQNGIPVAFIITSKCTKEDILHWLTSLCNRMVKHREDWYSNALIVDCAKAELNCIAFVHKTLISISLLYL